MWLIYLDESGNTGRRLDDLDQPTHWLVAVAVPEGNVIELSRSLDALLGRWLPGVDAELHGEALYSGSGPWKGFPPATRIDVYREALGHLDTSGSFVAYASIDKVQLARRYQNPDSPHLLAFQFLVEKLEQHLRSRISPLEQRGLLIADQTHEHEAFAIEILASLQRSGQGVVRGLQLDRIIDTVHFVRSETNRGVQLADLVAYLLNRSRRISPDSVRPADVAVSAMMSELITPHVRTYRADWPPKR